MEEALVRGTGAAVGKRHRTSTPVADVTNPEKRAKSDPGQGQEAEGSMREQIPTKPRDSSAPGEPQLQMSTAVWLERFRTLGKGEEMSGVIEGPGDTPRSKTTSPAAPTKSPGSTKKTKSQVPKKSGASAQETAPGEARPSSKTKRQRPNPPSSGASDTKFGSVLHPRSQTEWEQLCKATDMDTGQLKENVGTPDDPLFTYEEAVRQRGTDRNLLLWVGPDIVPAEEDEFPKKKSEGDLKRIRKQADEGQLPQLPTGVLPGGWNALGRPWAPIDCPAEKVPRIPSAHGTSRVTVAALVSFPPEPFFFVNLVHLDGVVRVKNKVGHVTYLGLQGELNQDHMLKDACRTYGRVKPPGYGDSIPFQECLKASRWSAYREGRWGTRVNPPDDESSSDSCSRSQPPSSSSESSPGPRQRVRRLTCRMLYFEPEEVSDSTTGEAIDSPAATFPALCGPSNAVLTEEVNTALAHRGQVEADEAAAAEASPVIVRTSRARPPKGSSGKR